MSKTAEQAWKELIVNESNQTVIAIDDIPTDRWRFVQKGNEIILSLYKQALRSLVQKKLDKFMNSGSSSKADENILGARIEECKTFLELLDTVTPTKEYKTV